MVVLKEPHPNHIATLLADGRVIIKGGCLDISMTEYCDRIWPDPCTPPTYEDEIYDPESGIWSYAGTFSELSSGECAGYPSETLLENGDFLLAGEAIIYLNPASVESQIKHWAEANTFTGTLILPANWLNSNSYIQFIASTTDAAVTAGALSNDTISWGAWVPMVAGEITTTAFPMSSEGFNQPIHLKLRDMNGQTATVATGYVNVDLTNPTSSMTALPATSLSNVPLVWSGSDTTSGIAGYDLQVREGTGGQWIDALSNTPATSTTYNGTNGKTYYFRVRAIDVAGNTEDWPADFDTFTLVDMEAPTGTIVINNGALSTTSIGVRLALSGQDVYGNVAQMQFSNDGITWADWETYAGSKDWSLSSGDGPKTVYVQFKDQAGNISQPITATIQLDSTANPEYGLSINFGALFTNKVDVTLYLGAEPFTAQMLISNDGGFAGAVWEPYSSQKLWQITQYGHQAIPRTVYARFKSYDNILSSTYTDDIILDTTPPHRNMSMEMRHPLVKIRL